MRTLLMRRFHGLLGLALLSASALAVVVSAKAAPSGAERAPVLVELFTSEGCSSCPPADEVIANLERTQRGKQGPRVIVLAHHVDYWDNLGWPDPFATAEATARQRAYAPLGGRIYTPQAIVDGHTEMVGSRAGALASAIDEAAKQPHVAIGVSTTRSEAGAYAIRARVGPLVAQGGDANVELVVALTQDHARVVVPRGENAGKTLEHTSIARRLVRVGKVGAGGGDFAVSLEAPPGVAARDLRVVVFAQEKRPDRTNGRILGTAEVALEPR